jgi:hypothetical protein
VGFIIALPENRQIKKFRIPPEVALKAFEHKIWKDFNMEGLH